MFVGRKQDVLWRSRSRVPSWAMVITLSVNLTMKHISCTTDTLGGTVYSTTSNSGRDGIWRRRMLGAMVAFAVRGLFAGGTSTAARTLKRFLTQFSCLIRENLGSEGSLLGANLLSPHCGI